MQRPFFMHPLFLPSPGGCLPSLIFKSSSPTGFAGNRLPCFFPFLFFSSFFLAASPSPFPAPGVTPRLAFSSGLTPSALLQLWLQEHFCLAPPLWPGSLSVLKMSCLAAPWSIDQSVDLFWHGQFWSVYWIRYNIASGGGNDNPLRYSCLKNPMDRGACPWGLKESPWLSDWACTISLLCYVWLF